MGEMTLKEKIGQLNLLSTGSIVTTSTPNDDNATEKIRRGEVGAVLNLQGVEENKGATGVCCQRDAARYSYVFRQGCDSRL